MSNLIEMGKEAKKASRFLGNSSTEEK